MVAHIFWWGQVEEELRDLGLVDYRFKKDGDRERCMLMIDEKRRDGLYPHLSEDCTEDCKARGES